MGTREQEAPGVEQWLPLGRRAGRTRKHGIRMVTTKTAVEERQQHSKEGIAIEHGWSLSTGEGGREHVRVTEGPLWPLGSIYELHWYSLNKKKGFGGWAPGNLGNWVCSRTFYPSLSALLLLNPRMRNGGRRRGPKAKQEAFCNGVNCSVKGLVWFWAFVSWGIVLRVRTFY